MLNQWEKEEKMCVESMGHLKSSRISPAIAKIELTRVDSRHKSDLLTLSKTLLVTFSFMVWQFVLFLNDLI